MARGALSIGHASFAPASPIPCPSAAQGDRFQAHSKLGNRKLLWHGTNVAVVAAILTSGLRITPHSGGRFGKGIYFTSENSKSGEAPSGLSPGRSERCQCSVG